MPNKYNLLLQYSKNNNHKSVDKMLLSDTLLLKNDKTQLEGLSNDSILEGFKIACQRNNILTIDAYLKYYDIDFLLSRRTTLFMLFDNIELLCYLLKNRTLSIRDMDMYYINGLILAEKQNIVDLLLEYTDLYYVAQIVITDAHVYKFDELKYYITLYMRKKKITQLKNG